MNNCQQETFLPMQTANLNSHINVSVRLKPVSDNLSKKSKIWEVVNDKTVLNKQANESYAFDSVFDSDTTNETIFRSQIEPMINNALKGFNATVLAYG